MKVNGKTTGTALLAMAAMLLCFLFPLSVTSAGPSAPAKGSAFPAFELPIPQSEVEKSYLGLSGTGNFRVGHIKPGIVIIEVFSFSCPFCHQAAPAVEETYKRIQARPDLRDRVRMIGIGLGDSVYEARTFKEKYRVPFPVFSDRDMHISRILGVKGTPTFIGVKVDGKGSEELFYFAGGVYDSPSRFLSDIMKASENLGEGK